MIIVDRINKYTNIFDRDMSFRANNQHYVNDIDRQERERKEDSKFSII
jgi:hypothetical protein